MKKLRYAWCVLRGHLFPPGSTGTSRCERCGVTLTDYLFKYGG